MNTLDIPEVNPPGQGGNSVLAGRYRLHGVVGSGAMASVYRAVDETLGRDVAVKLFLPGSGGDEFRMRRETEMRLLAGFEHPGLVSLYDAGTDVREPDAPRAFLVMEFVPGADLRTLLDGGPLTAAEAARIGECLAGALAQVHSNGVIHRDIKPANILIPEARGVAAKLADFGVARIVDTTHLTATGMTVGTASYLSPEQAMGRELTTASDIYSLGLVLLECLSGRPEYPGTPMESAAARLHRAPHVPASLGPAYSGLLAAMTDLEPGRRPTAEAVARSLGVLLDSFDSASTAPTRTIPELPDRPPAALATAKLPATRPPATRLPATSLPAERRPRGRRRKRPHPARRIGVIIAVAAAATITVPVLAAAVQDGGQEPVSGITTTTPAGTASPAVPGSASPSTPPTGAVPAPTTAVPVPTGVVPTPALTSPAAVATSSVSQVGNGNGNAKSKNH